MTMKRRELIKTAAAVAAGRRRRSLGGAKRTRPGGDPGRDAHGPHPGILDFFGVSINECFTMAVEETNEAGGLLGRPVRIIPYDCQTNNQLYAQYAQRAALQDKVHVVHGGVTSASREVIRPILGRSKTLYFYNQNYEGGVCDRNCFLPGTTPGHSVKALIDYSLKHKGKRFYTLAADYNYGQILSAWAKKYALEQGGEVIAEDFFPLDVADFGSTILKIQEAKPDFVFHVAGRPAITLASFANGLPRAC